MDRDRIVLGAVAVLTLLLLSSLSVPPVRGDRLTTDVNITPQFLSSAPPNLFVGENFTYALTSQVPVNWTCLICPLSTIVGGPLSKFAGLHGTPTSPGPLAFSVRIRDATYNGGIAAWQNWTATVLADPRITSSPSFLSVPGLLYDYRPFKVGGAGSWAFSGAPFLTLNATTGEVKGTALAGTFQNALTFTVSGVSWSQYWAISSTTVAPTITFSTTIGSHSVTATFPTTDVAGSGFGGVYLGIYPVLNSTSYGTFDAYNLTYYASASSYLLGVTGTPHAVTLDVYGLPLSTVTPRVNGAPLTPVSEPSSGFSLVTYTGVQSPSNLKGTATSDTSVSLTWNNPSGTLTNVSVARTAQSGSSCPFVNGTGTSLGAVVTNATVTGLSPGIAYCFAVQAWSSGVASMFSNIVVVTMPYHGGPPAHGPGGGIFPVTVPPGLLIGYGLGEVVLIFGLFVLLVSRSRRVPWLAVGIILFGVALVVAVSLYPSFFIQHL